MTRIVLPRSTVWRARTRIIPPRMALVAIPLPPIPSLTISIVSTTLSLPLAVSSSFPVAVSLRITSRTLSARIPRIVLPSAGSTLSPTTLPITVRALCATLSVVSRRIVVVFSATSFRRRRRRSSHRRCGWALLRAKSEKDAVEAQKSNLAFSSKSAQQFWLR